MQIPGIRKTSRKEPHWVQGTFLVKHVRPVRFGMESSAYRLIGEVRAPDLPVTQFSCVENLPSIGELRDMELPVIVDRTRPSRILIQWDKIPDLHQFVQDALHERSRREAEPRPVIPGPKPFEVVTQALRAAPPMDASTFARATPATAEVTAVIDELAQPRHPGKSGEPIAVLTLDLAVSPPDGAASYPARCVVEVRSEERRAHLTTPGTQVPVRIHPDNPARVGIDEQKMRLDRRQQPGPLT
jgi:hypothetical protein